MSNGLLDFYEVCVRRALLRPGVTVVALTGVFLISLALYPLLGLAFFPQTDAGQFTINLKVPTGTRLEVTEQYVVRVEDLIRDTVDPKDMKMVVSNLGVVPDFSSLYTTNAGPYTATIQVALREDHRKSSAFYMSFLFSEDKLFPTWWTRMPQRDPIITGWAPFQSAERLAGLNHSQITHRALQSVSRLLKVDAQDLESWLNAAYVHDWEADPYSRGAYSYGKVGAVEAQQVLARPIEHTLFFAGEATDTTGNNGTVHGLRLRQVYRETRRVPGDQWSGRYPPA